MLDVTVLIDSHSVLRWPHQPDKMSSANPSMWLLSQFTQYTVVVRRPFLSTCLDICIVYMDSGNNKGLKQPDWKQISPHSV